MTSLEKRLDKALIELEQKGLIIVKKLDGKDYLSLTNKSKQWLIKSEYSEKNPNKLGKKSETNSEARKRRARRPVGRAIAFWDL